MWPDGEPVTPWADPWHDVRGDVRSAMRRFEAEAAERKAWVADVAARLGLVLMDEPECCPACRSLAWIELDEDSEGKEGIRQCCRCGEEWA